MKFNIEFTRTKMVVVNERIEGEIDITKKEVQRITDCPNREDGDSTAWYGYVSEALEEGAEYKLLNSEVLETIQEAVTKENSRWDKIEVDWV